MLFKHPEVLWSLFLLVIPILIHLFQLRRFTKTPFTNVKLLQKVVAESRKSNSLKKWLLLFTRLLLLTALILSFAQPFLPGKSALKQGQFIIYLDNSFSMQAADERGTLLENKVQELLRSVPPTRTITLFTNERTFRDVHINEIKNELLSLPYTGKQSSLDEILLKAKSLIKDPSPENELVLISDFQTHSPSQGLDTLQGLKLHLVQALSKDLLNVAIDTLYVTEVFPESLELSCELTSSNHREPIPVSLYNGDRLIAKTSASFNEDLKGKVVFTLPSNEKINGSVVITDSGIEYDNQLFFNIHKKEKIKVISISGAPSNFLGRIFREDQFEYSDFQLNSLNYGILNSQNLIVLNELKSIPTALQNALLPFVTDNGSLVIIPHSDVDISNYNTLLNKGLNVNIISGNTAERKVSSIAMEHPLYHNVFEEKVTNFQYPSLQKYYKIQSNLPSLLTLDNGAPFLVADKGIYLFTAPLNLENSNFIRSPLVVPTFYNMGWNSLKLPRFYELIGQKSIVDIPIVLEGDGVLKVSGEDMEFIPYQQAYSNKTVLTFEELPTIAGNFQINAAGKEIGTLSFNHPRNESSLNYLDPSSLAATTVNNQLESLFQQLESDHGIKELWKWFVIFALAFILIEVLIQKYLK